MTTHLTSPCKLFPGYVVLACSGRAMRASTVQSSTTPTCKPCAKKAQAV